MRERISQNETQSVSPGTDQGERTLLLGATTSTALAHQALPPLMKQAEPLYGASGAVIDARRLLGNLIRVSILTLAFIYINKML